MRAEVKFFFFLFKGTLDIGKIIQGQMYQSGMLRNLATISQAISQDTTAPGP